MVLTAHCSIKVDCKLWLEFRGPTPQWRQWRSNAFVVDVT